MSSDVSSQKTDIKLRKKKKKKKRSASSPLNESERPNKSGYVSDNGGLTKSNNGNICIGGSNEGRFNSVGYNFDKRDNFVLPNMSFSQPFGGFNFPSQGSYPSTMQSPPVGTMPGMMGTPTATMTSQPPEWATALINDVRL